MKEGSITDAMSYDPENGKMYWVSGRFKGREVAPNSTHTTWREMTWRKSRIAWKLAYGRWPISSVKRINGDPLDLRLSNLTLTSREELEAFPVKGMQ